MPLPKPKGNESESEFVSRCMADSGMNSEFPDQSQRSAVCYNTYRANKSMKLFNNSIHKAIKGLKYIIKEYEDIYKYIDEINELVASKQSEGDLTMEGASMVSKIYSKCRADGGTREQCSRTAWAASDKAGYKIIKQVDILSQIQKSMKEINAALISKQTEPVDENITLKENYFDQLNYPAFLMNFPWTLSNNAPNNPWMEIPGYDGEINYDKAFSQWLELYRIMTTTGLVYVLPSRSGLQDLTYVANLGLKLPKGIAPSTVIVSNFTSEPRKGESDVGLKFFDQMEFNVVQAPYQYEGEADIKYIRDNIFVAGYGIRSDIKCYEWMMQEYNMQIIPVRMTNEYLYHFDTQFFPIDTKNALVVTKDMDPGDIKKIESIVNIVDVPESYGMLGSTNNVKIGNMVLNTSPILTLSKDDKEYDMERNRVDWLTDVMGKHSCEACFVNLSEFDKSGASLSCLVMRLSYYGIEPQGEPDGEAD